MAKSSNPSQGKFFAEKLTFNLAHFSPGPSMHRWRGRQILPDMKDL
jgi:hypothetical protein